MYKVGVALSGGGLKGFAHVGALKALEELGIKISYISGTSSGSIIAGLYASGFDIDEITEFAKENYAFLTKINKLSAVELGASFMLTGKGKIEGLMPGQNIENIVNKFVSKKGIKNMDEISIPYATTAVDTISTKECIFLSKEVKKKRKDVDYIYNAPISKAIRSSMSFPGVFNPCTYEHYNLIDGGTKDNLPVQILKDMGAKKVISISFKMEDYKPKKDLMGIIIRTVDIFALKDVKRAQKLSNYAIEVSVPNASLLEIDDIDKVIKVGYDAVMNSKLAKLKKKN